MQARWVESGVKAAARLTPTLPGRRAMASVSVPKWPRRKLNTILNIVPQGQVHVVERLGKFSGMRSPGYYFAVPFVDSVSYVVDLRETTLRIQPSVCVTQDNVSVSLDGVVFVQVTDPYKAAYGALHPFLAVVQHAQSVMRTAIGRRTLDEAFHDRVRLNEDIKQGIESSAANWGVVVLRYEVLEIQPDVAVAKAMDLQATAERRRREKVTTAEADKRAAVLKAEGLAEATERAAAADKRASVLEAEGAAEAVRLEASAAKAATQLEAEGRASALRSVAAALLGDGGSHAAGLGLADSYIRMMGEGMSRSNTLMMTGGGSGGPAAGSAMDGFDEALARAVVLAGTASNALTHAGSDAASGAMTHDGSVRSAQEENASRQRSRPGGASRRRSTVEQLKSAVSNKADDEDVDAELDDVLESARRSVDQAVVAKEHAIRAWSKTH